MSAAGGGGRTGARRSTRPAPGQGRRATDRRAVAARHTGPVEQAMRDAAELVAAAAAEAGAVARAVAMCAAALRRGKKVIFCGNGGSAAQASHLAGELSGRFYRERHALEALALTDNTAAITAIANDYGYDRVFERQLEAYGAKGDVLVALTTSGRSANMRRVVDAARRTGIVVIGLTGPRGRAFARRCDLAFVVPSADTARIQEIHLLLGHLICARVEEELFPHG